MKLVSKSGTLELAEVRVLEAVLRRPKVAANIERLNLR